VHFICTRHAVVLVALAACKTTQTPDPPPSAERPSASHVEPELSPVERAKRYPWPDGAKGFHTGMTAAEFDAHCSAAKRSVGDDGSHQCLRVPGAERDAMLAAGRFCGSTVCELLVSDGRADETDDEWLSAFEAKRVSLTNRFGPPRVEESTAPGCEGAKLVQCTGSGAAVRKYSWAFIGRQKEFLFVSLALSKATIALVFRNEAWLEREHARDEDGGR
jgi:hypothetical protein